MNMSPTEDERYLPEEVITEVLVRLPVKSIFQFRCVSKYWLHRIPNSNLISLHLNHTINFKFTFSNHTLRILSFGIGSRSGSNYDSKYLNIHSVQDFQQSSILMTIPPSSSIVVSNDGLVLMVDDMNKPRDLTLVNPTLKTSLLLPPCPIPLACLCVVYFIGFAPTTNDFKVIVLPLPDNDTDTDLFSAVYSINHGCWTTKNIDFDKRCRLVTCRILFTKGKAHWVSKVSTCPRHCKVVTFDIDAEKFSYFGLPLHSFDRVNGRRIHTTMDVFSLCGSLAIWYFSKSGFYIWVLDEVSHGGAYPMWTPFYHGVLSSNSLDVFLEIGATRKFWFDDKCSKFYIADGSRLLSYDFRGDEINYLGYSRQSIKLVDIYVETLLLCSQPGMDQPTT